MQNHIYLIASPLVKQDQLRYVTESQKEKVFQQHLNNLKYYFNIFLTDISSYCKDKIINLSISFPQTILNRIFKQEKRKQFEDILVQVLQLSNKLKHLTDSQVNNIKGYLKKYLCQNQYDYASFDNSLNQQFLSSLSALEKQQNFQFQQILYRKQLLSNFVYLQHINLQQRQPIINNYKMKQQFVTKYQTKSQIKSLLKSIIQLYPDKNNILKGQSQISQKSPPMIDYVIKSNDSHNKVYANFFIQQNIRYFFQFIENVIQAIISLQQHGINHYNLCLDTIRRQSQSFKIGNITKTIRFHCDKQQKKQNVKLQLLEIDMLIKDQSAKYQKKMNKLNAIKYTLKRQDYPYTGHNKEPNNMKQKVDTNVQNLKKLIEEEHYDQLSNIVRQLLKIKKLRNKFQGCQVKQIIQLFERKSNYEVILKSIKKMSDVYQNSNSYVRQLLPLNNSKFRSSFNR